MIIFYVLALWYQLVQMWVRYMCPHRHGQTNNSIWAPGRVLREERWEQLILWEFRWRWRRVMLGKAIALRHHLSWVLKEGLGTPCGRGGGSRGRKPFFDIKHDFPLLVNKTRPKHNQRRASVAPSSLLIKDHLVLTLQIRGQEGGKKARAVVPMAFLRGGS